eukprot:CAMPEP_0170538258 /NCGR_PEP_ID=MMETSP0209-20121228/103204_1 /TAXON_ID=665100 ORGANISM="Litonotus pictus, Strain P1" /NCGR_SAMPLE_ID=MMETSP0209 /ASSEMBLY_ACC=CAM_ASM_000301 /LENGTH=197 /DNA_ID=CAMNT_0010839915 /DNA_START=533 /DNA_END=1122 /DNA_ORIENTATION=+
MGSFLAFLGGKFLLITIILIAFLSTAIAAAIILFAIASLSEVSTGVMWVIVAAILICTIGVTVLLYKKEVVFYMLLGAIMGFMVGVLVYNFGLRYVKSNPDLVYWLTVCGMIAVGVLIAYFFGKHLLIISTSIIGSYVLIRGSSYLIGGFPNEGEVLDLINDEEWEQLDDILDAKVYGYLAVFIVMLIGGLIVQYKL